MTRAALRAPLFLILASVGTIVYRAQFEDAERIARMFGIESTHGAFRRDLIFF